MTHPTLVADLPPMNGGDLTRFEAEGGIWGKQRSIRRSQVTVMGAITAVCTVSGLLLTSRRNTIYVMAGTAPIFVTLGMTFGHAVGIQLFPSVADNKETTMMRRTWWAKECAKNWDMNQVDGNLWHAAHPHSNLFKK